MLEDMAKGQSDLWTLSLAVCCSFPCLLSVTCEVWKWCCFYEFCLAAFCSMLLCLYATSCLSYVALSVCYVLLVLCCSACAHCLMIVYIIIAFNNLPRDCGWKLAGWLKPALLLKRWLMCTVPVKIKINSIFYKACQWEKHCACFNLDLNVCCW